MGGATTHLKFINVTLKRKDTVTKAPAKHITKIKE